MALLTRARKSGIGMIGYEMQGGHKNCAHLIEAHPLHDVFGTQAHANVGSEAVDGDDGGIADRLARLP